MNPIANSQKIVTLVGGAGFIGRYVVKLLAERGYVIRVISRNPDAALHLKTAGNVGQVVLVRGNLARPQTLEGKINDSYAVINLAGILFEAGRQNFALLHAQGAEKLAKLARAAGAQKFVQVSSIGVDKSVTSKYARTKATGEKAVVAAFPEATILRPSIVFGPEDGFFNKFAWMATVAPALPLIDGGNTKFQPVYVMDVARAIVAAIERPECAGQVYELGGPRVYTFKQLLEFILEVTHRKRFLIPIPMWLARIKALFLELLPNPPLTRDQVELLAYDNVVSDKVKTLGDLGIEPMAIESVVPEYLARFRKRGSEA